MGEGGFWALYAHIATMVTKYLFMSVWSRVGIYLGINVTLNEFWFSAFYVFHRVTCVLNKNGYDMKWEEEEAGQKRSKKLREYYRTTRKWRKNDLSSGFFCQCYLRTSEVCVEYSTVCVQRWSNYVFFTFSSFLPQFMFRHGLLNYI